MKNAVVPTVFGVYRVGLHIGKKVAWSLPVFALDDIVIEEIGKPTRIGVIADVAAIDGVGNGFFAVLEFLGIRLFT